VCGTKAKHTTQPEHCPLARLQRHHAQTFKGPDREKLTGTKDQGSGVGVKNGNWGRENG